MPSIAHFGSFQVNLATGELRKHGIEIRLPNQAFQILSILLEHPGEIISREQLRMCLWSGETFVDFDAGLNKVVNRLREALNDSAVNPRFIETVSKRGYRFLAPVRTSPTSSAAAGNASQKVRLAVLPFENRSPDSDQEFFSDGLTDEMISELGRMNPKRLGVIARTSTMRYKQSGKRVDEIGSELGVDYILEGSVRRVESRARITAQLIQVHDQTHLWTESYEHDMADIFEVQRKVARGVADSLALELLPNDTLPPRVVSPGAYEAYLRRKHFWNRGSDRDAIMAIHWFEQSLKSDPRFALAYSGLADCYGRLGWFGTLPAREAGEKAKVAAMHAVKLQGELGEAHAFLALAYFWHDWNWAAAEREFREAIDRKPNFAAAHKGYAAFLNVVLRGEEAGREQKIAQELNPFCLTIAMNAADRYYFARQYPAAIEHYESVLKRNPNFFPAHYNLGRTYLQAGMYEEAVSAFHLAARLSGVPQANAALALAYGRLGQIERAQAILLEMEQLGAASAQIAWIFLGLGEIDRAMEKLQKAFEERSFWMVYLYADPVYDDLRSHPEFQTLMKRMNFPVRAAAQSASGAN